MPLFDLQCKKCKIVIKDIILKKYHRTITMPMSNRCLNCSGMKFDTLAPLCAMQPDNMWSGQQTRFGYFTSKSEYNQTLKSKNIEVLSKKELDTVRKNVYTKKQAKKQERLNNLNSFIEKELSSVEVSPDGNTVKERNKYARKRQS